VQMTASQPTGMPEVDRAIAYYYVPVLLVA